MLGWRYFLAFLLFFSLKKKKSWKGGTVNRTSYHRTGWLGDSERAVRIVLVLDWIGWRVSCVLFGSCGVYLDLRGGGGYFCGSFFFSFFLVGWR